ncbi:MAG: mandelate racemase/muconate lactonizing enzyme family protein [Alphaproteobacteria bacterium]|nr:mandelate racemase/muconate lactonizing enzyme family protein [Alphaproteobacteria bacterium]
MKITSVEAIPLYIPLKESRPALPQARSSADHTVIRVETDEGITGIGEAFRFAPRSMSTIVEEVLAPILIGEDPCAIELLWNRMYRQTFRYGRAGIVLHAISGVEVALWDILGKTCGKPLAALLGGATKRDITAYASLHKLATPEDTAETALAMLEMGYTALKLHERDLASVEAVRKAIGPDVRLMVDASGAWSLPESRRMAAAMNDLGVYWLEEPLLNMDDYEGLASLRGHDRLRIAAGENEYTPWGFRTLLEAQAVDVVQPDVIKAGGVSATRKILAMAIAHGAEVCTHSFYFGPGVAATLHTSLATTECSMIEINPHDLTLDFMDPPLRPVNGRLTLPEAPGLGVTLIDDVVAKHDQRAR